MYVETFFYRGVNYRRYPESKNQSLQRYFYGRRDGKNDSLHRRIWEDHYGPIPKGKQIHHKDGDPGNNNIDNLECLTTAEHGALHRRDDTSPRAVYQREWARAHRTPTRTPPTEYTCAFCGSAFTSHQTDRAKYCSVKCHDLFHSGGPTDAVCVICCTAFKTSRSETACSPECKRERNRLREVERHKTRYTKREPKQLSVTCVVCKQPFMATRTCACVCSKECKKQRTLQLQRDRRREAARISASVGPAG